MLRALYDYAEHNKLDLPLGYRRKTIKAYVSITSAGEFVGIILGDDELVLCPDIGSLVNGKEKCNPIVEKSGVIFRDASDLEDKDRQKRQFFFQVLKDGSDSIPKFEACVKISEDQSKILEIQEALKRNKIKSTDRISFIVDGTKIVKVAELRAWWNTYRIKFFGVNKREKTLCLITGKDVFPMETVPKTIGLKDVGGHSSGDALICFDKSAFCSYEQEKSANAPVSEEAFNNVTTALEDLLKRAPKLANMKFVHWYNQKISAPNDPILDGNFLGIEIPDNNKEAKVASVKNVQKVARKAENEASKLIKSIESGEKSPNLSCQYTIILLTGVNGRIMVRQYENGSYEELKRNIDLWNQQLELQDIKGNQNVKSRKLEERLFCLSMNHNMDKIKNKEKEKKELSNVTRMIIYAIMHGTALPDMVAFRSLAYIRSRMLESDRDQIGRDQANIKIPDEVACQWLKVWLSRKEEGDKIMSEYNPEQKSSAYHCGAAMAVHAYIQNAAMNGVNATIVQKYYSGASQSPALVLGQVARLSAYHLDKMENYWMRKQYETVLNEVYCAIGTEIPVTLTLEQQAYFALGYRQMCTRLEKEKNERIESKKNARHQNGGEDEME